MMFDAKLYRYYAKISGAVFVKIALATGGFFLGRRLDQLYGTDPFLMFLGFVLGVSIGFWWVIRTANRLDR